ncbi:TonB-dependent receptor [Sphingomonas sp. KR3-1]|uniref:TonB-dependent receptor n=1 Tax=Sphingomonas sp. KR3-1 TaxID=3156611 RepID=UPI0032B5391B
MTVGIIKKNSRALKRGISVSAMAAATLVATGAVLLPTMASAQVSTASLRGQVIGADGAGVAGAQVSARSTGTNQTARAVADSSGAYVLNGLRPGQYEVIATSGSETVSQTVIVGIGESASLDLTLGGAPAAAAEPAEGGQIVVTGTRVREVRTSEVATNVSTTQIERLPQTDRNFLSFTALAPGVRYNDSETDKSFSSGASTASQVNVFIDGVSLKNQLREGGVAGQQNSRGNPFGQLAVQEFRVLTQNYKAEYEQAGAAIVTAITKSGTNEFHGEVFGQYTDKSLSEKAYLDKRNNRAEPAFERKQYGAALGGPIIKDKLFFFGAYEGNDQDRAFNVVAGGTPALQAAASASLGRDIHTLEGAFVSPFRSDFYFGKLTLTPDDRQTFDLSFSRRDESDIQAFGNNVSYEAAENKKNRVDTYQFKWAYNGDNFVNEFNASYLNYTFNPTSLHPELPQYEYAGVIIAGGKDSTRNEVQNSYTFRNDFTWSGLAGHVFKAGLRVQVTDITFDDHSYVQPHYTYTDNGNNGTPLDPTDDLSFAFPSEARLGLGSSLIQASNTQVGVYVQDDWNLTPKLQLNLGVRWDYETNGFNNDYVTPASAAAALRSLPKTYYFDPENYITDGHDRKPFAGAFAPRVGFSYDIKGDRSTVIFGGWGRYYDRNNFNNTVDELSRVLNPVGVFRFSATGAPRSGLPTVAWNPAYATRAGLLALQASAQGAGLPELFAVKNDAKPPVNDQFSLGVRQRFGVFEASITGSYQRGRNGYTNLFATRQNNGLGNCCDTSTVTPFGYANVLIGYDGLDTRYKALYFTLDKNYTKASGWGLNVAYTLSKAEQNGNDLFSLDGITPDAYGWRTRPGDERHRVVISGMVDLPLGFTFSTLTTLGSGQGYLVTDATQGFDVGKLKLTTAYPEKNCIEGLFAFCEVNLTLGNRFKIHGIGQVEAAVDVLNAFNNKNFKDFDGFFSLTDPLEPGRIGNNTVTLPRRIQFRLGYKF